MTLNKTSKPAASYFYTPMLNLPQPDGSILVKPGKPVELKKTIGTHEAARLLEIAPRTVQRECEMGIFKTARRHGGRPRSPWKIARSEVMERLAGVPPA
jgi:hypothetical protein